MRNKGKEREFSEHFHFAMSEIKWEVGRINDDKEKMLYLDYVVDTIKSDICKSSSAQYLYSMGMRETFGFPYGYYNEQGEYCYLENDERISVNIKEKHIYSRPRSVSKIKELLFKIHKNGFIYEKKRHINVFYTDIDLLCVTDDGNHSLHTAKYLGIDLLVESKLFHTERLYPYIYTDGVYWYNRYGGRPYAVKDFRTAILYETAKMRYDIYHKAIEAAKRLQDATEQDEQIQEQKGQVK